MQIHELDTFLGVLGDDTFLAVDDGVETNKVPASQVGVSTEMTIAEAVAGTVEDARVITPKVLHEFATVLVLDIASFSALPHTVSDDGINASMICIKAELGTPSAQTSDWTVDTSDGSLQITGTISGSTTAKLYLINER